MNRRERIEAAFDAALDQPATARSEFLAALRETEPDVAQEVEELLYAHERSDGILDSQQGETSSGDRHIGPYKVLQELGRGGMGVVYLAERDDGHFRRRVALKLLRGSPDADELHQRFVAERQILALLDHPNISQLIDGGVTDGRLPYLVMEYVDGLPITDYCDRHRLTIAERLRLFLDVCAAVHHAHRNLIIHRDLKPGNILVTQRGQVKLLDFGIAKLLNPGLAAMHSPVTRQAQRVLTPEYASPEQLQGDPLSTTSDVYSLGIVLFELLTGCRPQRENSAGSVAPPAKASMTVADSKEIANARQTAPEHLRRSLRGDLDAILALALRSEPSRRYGSAELLAQDIERHLQNLPVTAHRGSRWYHAEKFVRRHWLAAAAVTVAAVSLIAGTGVALRQRALAHQERDRAEQALVEAQRITGYLISLFEVNDPYQKAGQEVTAEDLLRRGRQQAENLTDQPLVQARMFHVIGRVYHARANYVDARGLLERALSLREAHLGVNHPDVAQTVSQLAETYRFASRYVEADAAARRALDIRVKAYGPDHPDVGASLLQCATMAVFLADVERAMELTRRAVRVLDAAGTNDSLIVVANLTLGAMLGRTGLVDEAEKPLQRAITIARRGGAETALLANSLLGLAYVIDDIPQRAAEAEALYRQGIAIRGRVLGEDHPLYGFALGDFAIFLHHLNRHAEALAIAERHYRIIENAYGRDNPRTAEVMATYAQALHSAGRQAEGIAVARQSLAIREKTLGKHHNSYANALTLLASLLHASRAHDEAERLTLEAIAVLRKSAGGKETGLVALAYSDLAAIQMSRRNYRDAELSIQHAFRILQEQKTRPAYKDYQLTVRRAIDLYTLLGQPAEVRRYRAMLL